jgi:hypothetical protein
MPSLSLALSLSLSLVFSRLAVALRRGTGVKGEKGVEASFGLCKMTDRLLFRISQTA